MIRSRVRAWTIPATGVRPPLFTFVAVRAIAPVAGIPPKSGETMFATPWATSSMFERCLPPIMPSATTADSSDSIPASSAIVKAGPTSAVAVPSVTCGKRAGEARVDGAEPAADGLDREPQEVHHGGGTSSAMNGAGIRPPSLGHSVRMPQGQPRDGHRRPMRLLGVPGVLGPLAEKVGRKRPDEQAEQILDLTGKDDEGDAAGESGHHREGNELDRAAQPGQSETDEDDAAHQRGDHEPVEAVALHDAVDDHDEGARGPADLHPRSAQRGDQEARDDRGVEPTLRRDTAGDRERDGQRQRDDPDDDPRADVGHELGAVVRSERREQLRNEQRWTPGDNLARTTGLG